MKTTTDKADLAVGQHERVNMSYVYLITAVAAVGGFLFGFDTAIIAGAIGFITTHFHLEKSPELVGFAVSSVLIGCMIGASISGVLSDKFGRKKVLLAAALIFVATAILASIPKTLMQFALARLLMGVAVGIESVLSPLYIAEIAPAKIRGKLVTLNHVALSLGMLSAYAVALIFEPLGADMNWRWMFASGAIPAAIFTIALLRVPESPRWLTKQGLSDQAVKILARISGEAQAQKDMQNIKETIEQESSSFSQMLLPGLRTAMIIGIVLAIFQQITGINVILYYAPEVFKQAGLPIKQALWSAILVGLMGLISNYIATLIIDKVGRKKILIFGTASMCVFLALTGLYFQYPKIFPPFCAVVFVLGYVVSFGVGLGPGFWTILSEIFPTRVRGRAMSVATFFIWSSCFLVAQTFPSLLKNLGAPKTFWLYGIMCLLTIAFTWIFVPETKGKALEEIETAWLRKRK